MTRSSLYILRWVCEDGGVHDRHFHSTERLSARKFELLCERLLDRAAENAAQKNKAPVGWGSIIEEVAKLLEGKGFKPFNPKVASFGGSDVIYHPDDAAGLSKKALDVVIEHNIKIEERSCGAVRSIFGRRPEIPPDLDEPEVVEP